MRKINIAICAMWILCIFTITTALMACSNEHDDNIGSLRINAFAYERPTVTRAADGYMDFQNVYNATPETPATMVFWVCMGTTYKVENTASYNGTDWSTSCHIEGNTKPYDFYSYMPGSIPNVTASLTSTTDPATITFSNIPAVIGEDLIISEATTSGNSETTNPYDQIITSEEGQSVTFRMQHVLAKLSFSFSNPAGKSFTDMRKTVVREVQVLPATSSYRYNVTCTMNKTSAITYNWETVSPVTPDYFAITNDKEFNITEGKTANGYLVNTEATEPFGSCYLVPFTGETIKIRAIYDVYAHDGSLIRENEISVNNNLKITNSTAVDAAKEYKISVKIIPDYLYMLADVDAGTSLEIKTE